jgi:hypothetical protein
MRAIIPTTHKRGRGHTFGKNEGLRVGVVKLQHGRLHNGCSVRLEVDRRGSAWSLAAAHCKKPPHSNTSGIARALLSQLPRWS